MGLATDNDLRDTGESQSLFSLAASAIWLAGNRQFIDRQHVKLPSTWQLHSFYERHRVLFQVLTFTALAAACEGCGSAQPGG